MIISSLLGALHRDDGRGRLKNIGLILRSTGTTVISLRLPFADLSPLVSRTIRGSFVTVSFLSEYVLMEADNVGFFPRS